MGERPKYFRNLHENAFIMFFLSFSGKLISEMSPLELGKILGVFLNTFTSDGKYLVQGCENLQLPIQMQISEKQKPFSEVFLTFLDSTSNFEHFERKDDPHS